MLTVIAEIELVQDNITARRYTGPVREDCSNRTKKEEGATVMRR
jgi:hypothetical protein